MYCKTTQFLFILLILFCSSAVYGDSKQACLDKAVDADWSKVEKWVWKRICKDEIADLDDYIKEEQELGEDIKLVAIKQKMDFTDRNYSLQLCKVHINDLENTPKNAIENTSNNAKEDEDEYELDPESEGWNKHRLISLQFLRDILLNESLVSKIQSSGVIIKGAYFKERIKLQNARINFPLRLESSLFKKVVNLNSIHVKDVLSFDNSYFKEKFKMKSATVTGDLSMKMANFDSVLLTNTNIRDNLDISGAKGNNSDEKKKLEMDSIIVGSDIVMCGVINFHEVDLEAAHIGGTLYMTGAILVSLEMDLITIDDDLLMRYGADFEDVDLARAHIGANLDITQSKIGKLDMDSISIGNNLLMRGWPKCKKNDICSYLQDKDKYSSEFSEVDLHGARISGRMSLTGTTLVGELNMNSIFIREDLHMREATFKKEVTLTNADIGDELSMSCSTFEKLLEMDSINVGTNLLMNYDVDKRGIKGAKKDDYSCDLPAKFEEITIKNATIGHNLEMIGSEVGTLDMNSSNIGGNLEFMKAKFEEISLQYIQVDQNLNLQKAKINSKIDLTGASIRNTLNFNLIEFTSPPKKTKVDKSENTELTLHNASTSAFFMPKMWPKEAELNGFEYQKIENEIIDDALLDSVLGMLAAMKVNTPQPYVQLANVLRDMGLKNLADKVIIAKMDQKLEQADNTLTLIKLTVFKYFINYGYAYYYSLFWMLILVISGYFFIRLEQNKIEVKDEKLEGELEKLFYSINMLLPIIQLNKRHEDIKHDNSYVRNYFYVHKILGYVIAITLVTSLSGMLAPEGY